MSAVVAIRGAVQVSDDSEAAIDRATRALLEAIVARNRVDVSDVVAVWFTQTADLAAGVPAAAARRAGWTGVPFLCAQEPAAGESLPRTVRALVLAALDRAPRHVYLGAAAALRPDWADEPEEDDR